MTATSAGIYVRPATESDAGPILDLLNPIIETGKFTVMTASLEMDEEAAWIREAAAKGVVFVAVDPETLVIVGLQSVEPVSSEPALKHVGDISTFVSLHRHGAGIGQMLTEATLQHARARGFLKIMATIRADNPQAVSFYMGQGFRIIGIARKHALLNGRFVDEVVAELLLEGAIRHTGKTRLREVEDSDIQVFFEQQLDPDAIQMAAFSVKDPADRDAFAAQWARNLANPTILTRTVVVDGDEAGEVAGYLGRFERFGKREVCYWLGREYWGKGVATRALIEFLSLNPSRPLFARVAVDNVGSIRVLEKCGFVPAGHDRAFSHSRGCDVEETVFVLE